MTAKETHTNTTILRVLLAAAAVLILCGAAVGAVAGADNYQVGDTKYETLSAAYSAVEDGGTITVLQDVTEAAQTAMSGNKSVTLDLSRHTISASSSFSGTALISWKSSGASLTIKGEGTLNGNDKARVLSIGAGEVILENGTITGGHANGCGGVFVMPGATFTVKGGSISGNTAETQCGGVFAGGTFNVSGNTVIKDNKVTGKESNVYLSTGFDDTQALITVTGALNSGAYIGIANPLSGQFGAAGKTGDTYYKITSSDAACFHQDAGSLTALIVPGLTDSPDKLYWPVAKIGTTEYAAVQAAVDAIAAMEGKTGDIVMINNSAEPTITIPGDTEITLDLAGHVLKNDGKGSVIRIENTGSLTLIDTHTASDVHWFTCSGEKDQAWKLCSDPGTVTSPDIKYDSPEDFDYIAANETIGSGGAVYIKVTGGCITGGGGGSGGVFVDGGAFTMNGGNIIGNSYTTFFGGYGGGVHIKGTNGMFTMTGGTIAGNCAGPLGCGGGVGVDGAGSTFEMKGGNIIGNSSFTSGGGVGVSSGTFTMSGSASIAQNGAPSGGGVYVGGAGKDSKGTFVMSGSARITENVGITSVSGGERNGCGVYVSSYGTSSVSGSPVIKDNTPEADKNKASNVYLETGFDNQTLITVSGALGSDAYIGIANPLTGDFAQGAAHPSGESTGGYKLALDDGQYFHPDTGAAAPKAALTAPGTDANPEDSRIGWVDKMAAKIGGTEYATVSVAVAYAAPDATITMIADSAEPTVAVDKKVTIDLAGHVLSNNGVAKPLGADSLKSVIYVKNGGILTVNGTTATPHKFRVDTGEYPALWILDETAGTKTLTGGCITGGSGSSGGGVYIADGGRFTLSGNANIVGNTATIVGGGVYVEGGSFEMEGAAAVSGNTANVWGGGVCLWGADTEFIMSGSTKITGNTATMVGGGVYVRSGSFEMKDDAAVSGNEANDPAGYPSTGGGVYVEDGEFTMSGTTKVTENKATGYGGGVAVGSDGKFNISGKPFIKNNTGKKGADNVSLFDENSLFLTAPLTDGEIRITYAGADPAAGVKFGTTENGPAGAERFVADVDEGDPLLIGSISGTDLVWKGKPVTVTFNENGHGAAPAQVTVDSGSKITKPEDPSAEGQAFCGWFTESSCTHRWDFDSDTVIDDMTLYAKWMADKKEAGVNDDPEHQGTKKADTQYDIPPVTPDSDYVPAKLDSVSLIPGDSGVEKVKCGNSSVNPPRADSTIKTALTVVEIKLLDSSGKSVTSLTSPAAITISLPESSLPSGVTKDNAGMAHYAGGKWVVIPSTAKFEGDNLVVTGYSGTFSPFAVVQIQPKSSPSSSSQGSSVWLTDDTPAQPTATPTPTPEPVATPGVKPVNPTETPAKTPVPFAGVLAGLGAAASLFGLRRK